MSDQGGLVMAAFGLLLLALIGPWLFGTSIEDGPKRRDARDRQRAQVDLEEPALPDLTPASPLRRWKGIRIDESATPGGAHFRVEDGSIRVGDAWRRQDLVTAEAVVIVRGAASPLRGRLCRALAQAPFRLEVLEEEK